eukprot:COSAG02_NODE_1053_length_14943_cov_3.871076_15_plen_77_part_00
MVSTFRSQKTRGLVVKSTGYQQSVIRTKSSSPFSIVTPLWIKRRPESNSAALHRHAMRSDGAGRCDVVTVEPSCAP